MLTKLLVHPAASRAVNDGENLPMLGYGFHWLAGYSRYFAPTKAMLPLERHCSLARASSCSFESNDWQT